MMVLHEHVYTETASLGQQDTTVVVAVSGSAMLVLVLAACVCWRRNSSGLLSGREDSRRDTVPLDDLLSKPSLADPESVFSEAGSNDFRPIPRAGSRFVASGDENSFWHESGSVSGASHGDLDASSSHFLVGLNNDPDPNTQCLLPRRGNYQGIQLIKAAQLELKQLQLQIHQNVDKEATCRLDLSHRFKSTAESGYLGDRFGHEVRASVHTASGSPKTASHKDISEKVGLDPASLKIHRDSVSGDSAPFLSSARCSFSHEVGHIVHGNQTPRPSLPRTEEVENDHADSSPDLKNVDDSSREATGLSVEGKAAVISVECKATELSVNVHSGQFEELTPTNLTFNSQGQIRGQRLLVNETTDSNHGVSLGYPRVTIQDTQKPGRELIASTTADGYEHPAISREISPSKSHVKNHTITGRPASDLDQYQLADVTMRRCLSCVQDDAVCPDPPTKPRRQTFSLNLKIDVHFDNERESCENLPTVVCSPLIECTRPGQHAAADTCQRYATSVSINDKNNHNNINNSSSQGGCHVDTDAKERQLEKSFAEKSHYANRHRFVGAGQQCSQLPLAEFNQVKTCNTGQPNGRFSAAESLTTAAARADAEAASETTNAASPGDCSRQGVSTAPAGGSMTADSDSEILKPQCQLSEAVRPEAESNTKTDQADLRSEAETKERGTGPSMGKVVPLFVTDGDRLLLAGGAGGRAGNIADGDRLLLAGGAGGRAGNIADGDRLLLAGGAGGRAGNIADGDRLLLAGGAGGRAGNIADGDRLLAGGAGGRAGNIADGDRLLLAGGAGGRAGNIADGDRLLLAGGAGGRAGNIADGDRLLLAGGAGGRAGNIADGDRLLLAGGAGGRAGNIADGDRLLLAGGAGGRAGNIADGDMLLAGGAGGRAGNIADGDRLLAGGAGGRAGNIIVVNNTSSTIGQHKHSCDVIHTPRETEPVSLNGESLGEVKVAEEILSQKKRPTASRIKDDSNGGLVGATHNHTGESSCHHPASVNTTETNATSITNTSHHHPEDAHRTEAVVSSQRVEDSGHSKAEGCKPESIVATTLSNPGCEDSINTKTHPDSNLTVESTETKTHPDSNLTGVSTERKTHPDSNVTVESTETKTHPDSNVTVESTETKTHPDSNVTVESTETKTHPDSNLTGVSTERKTHPDSNVTGVSTETKTHPDSNVTVESTETKTHPDSNVTVESTETKTHPDSNVTVESTETKTHPDSNLTGVSTETKTHPDSNLTGVSTETKTHPDSNLTGVSTETKTHPDSNLTGVSTERKTHWDGRLREEIRDADRAGSVDTPGEGPVQQTAAVKGATRRPDIHRRALTMKAGHVRTMSQTNETGDVQFQRSSSVKMTSVGERARPSLGSSDKRQDRRQAVFFHDMKDLTTECPRGGSQEETRGKQSEYPAPAVIARKQEGDTGSKVDTNKLNKKDQMTSEATQTHSNPGQEGPETIPTGRTQMMKQRLTGSTLRGYANIPSHERAQGSAVELVYVSPQDKGTVPRQISKAPKPAPRHLPADKHKRISPVHETGISASSGITINIEDCSGGMETADVSDDSDYDNPWDSLDDAVKRASIRYNRRPSRIAAGDTKTLLLKSAEDLGRLLEEADKRRQFRQTRNSCQVVSPETDSFTIPFTRCSPYRHTVKDTVSQSQMTTAHSTETLLKTETPSYPQLSLLRSGDSVAADHRVLDARRPMSLTSKVRAQITSPETKQRKK